MGKSQAKYINQKLFGEAISFGRKANGMTQEAMASKVGILPASLSYYESGSAAPSLDTAYRIAQVLGTDLTSLLEGNASEYNNPGGLNVLSLSKALEAIILSKGVKIEADRADRKIALTFEFDSAFTFFIQEYYSKLNIIAQNYANVRGNDNEKDFNERMDDFTKSIFGRINNRPISDYKITNEDIAELYERK